MSNSDSARLAVIAVHGVADQQPGDTARALADLLVVAGPDTAPAAPRYRVTGADELGLRVAPLQPSRDGAGSRAAGGAQPPASGIASGWGRAWRQSTGSDLHRSPPAEKSDSGSPPPLSQPDIELTDFLLAQAVRNRMPAEAFDTRRLSLGRQAGGPPQQLHVYEMYWADLSRLSGKLPRILTELFTLISRLSQLGRDTLAAAARQYGQRGEAAASWRLLDRSQAALDWLFSRVLAQLMLQLLLVCLLLLPLGWMLSQPALLDRVRMPLVLLLPALLWLLLLYRQGRHLLALLVGAAAAAALSYGLAQLPPAWLPGLLLLAGLALLTDTLLRICDARFPMTRAAGGLMGLLSLGTVLLTGLGGPLRQTLAIGGTATVDGLALFQTGALRAMELLLLGTVGCWLLLGPLLVVWLLLGLRCARSHGYAGRASVATGRLGLFVSMAFFLTLVMAGWALLHPLLLSSVGDLVYTPRVFKLQGPDGAGMAVQFLVDRYISSTETFSLVAVLVFGVVFYLMVGLLPSLLAEAGLLAGQALPLGRWLTRTYRYLDSLMALLIVAAVAVTLLVVVDLALTRLGSDALPALREAMGRVRMGSQHALNPLSLALAAASATATITVLGGLLSRYLPGVRGPLDVALDVDNHFREFPRHGIPRARIFSRYAALLRHLVDQGYERIVIVAHSQGTVLTAEMLRYLQARAADPQDIDEAALLGRALAGRVHLLTAGCPLRQLYASRFPVLYPWVLQPQQWGAQAVVGPTPAAIGVQRWVNVYTTGDYVGRWLWSSPPQPGIDRSDTLLDRLHEPLDVYRSAHDAAALRALLARQRSFDVCLGAGAHTHYFESQQGLVAGLVDGLLTTPCPP